VLVGLDILEVKDVSSLALRRPVDRGYVTAWDVQKEVWARALRRLYPNLQPSNSGIVLTEPYFNLPALREAALQVLFQELGFAAVVMVPPAVLSLRWFAATVGPPSTGNPASTAAAVGCGLVIDAGFSFTHAVPVFDWHVVASAVKRIDLGGKALTNYMKELVSYRSINMMDESYLLEHIKDNLAFVSQNPLEDLAASRRRDSPFKKEWLLPDGVTSTWGQLVQPGEPRGPKDPILVINNERFMVPEALFNPADIGMEQEGLAEVIFDAISSCHPHIQGLLYSNVVLTGGMAKCPGIKERLETELRPLVPDDYILNVTVLEEPEKAAWKGGALLAGSPAEFRARAVSRAEWQQHGAAACGGRWDA
jgi:actin-related protein 6